MFHKYRDWQANINGNIKPVNSIGTIRCLSAQVVCVLSWIRNELRYISHFMNSAAHKIDLLDMIDWLIDTVTKNKEMFLALKMWKW